MLGLQATQGLGFGEGLSVPEATVKKAQLQEKPARLLARGDSGKVTFSSPPGPIHFPPSRERG